MKTRTERNDDRDKIRSVHVQAFDTDAEARLVDQLRETGIDLVSLVAEEQGVIIGHILFSPVTLDASVRTAGLAPMAVLPGWQRKGVGALLVNEGLRACGDAGYEAVVVLGHPDYYPRFGFEPSAAFGIDSEYDVPPEVFMVKELREGALSGKSGTVRYHPVFNAF